MDEIVNANPWMRVYPEENRVERDDLVFNQNSGSQNIPDNCQPGYDPCARFAPLVEVANDKFKYYYKPRQELSVDESLIGTKNKTQLIQCMPNKHHHQWGIKLWVLCESVTAYVVAFFVYKGKRGAADDEGGLGLGHEVVIKLLNMANLLRKGYHDWDNP
ncbi:hypothetical protein RRG08_065254 [Elysia crispata]|uniref:PiggyBac transposable element-derived protein domain-containing protein n=1 Tax=Elysia crispata TaxID=231223 RepID=A0AAE1AXU0_9GAST|nr:hypothetical protein RRG08_065254 [Elysia crispata]